MSLTAAQLELRRTGITATDVVILAGFSRWGSPLEVYESKLGAPPKPQTLAMAMGHAAEGVIMDRLAEKHGLTLAPGETIRDPIQTHFLATPDRFVLDKKGERIAVCEAKLVGFHLVPEWLDPDDPNVRVFPDSVAAQTAWQMGVSRKRRNYVGALLGGWRDEDYHDVVVDLNEDLWLALAEIADRFWKDHVLARVPPPPDASEGAREALGRLFPAIKRPVLEPASADTVARMERYLAINAELARLAKEKDQLGNELRLAIGDAQGLRGPDCKATWLPQDGRVSATKLAAHFGLSEQELAQFRGEGGRVLRVAPLSKKEKAYDAAVRALAAAE